MPSTAIAGTRLASCRCDLRRISTGVLIGITPTDAARSAHSQRVCSLPIGRYLHNASGHDERASRMVGGNRRRPWSNSKARLSFVGTLAGADVAVKGQLHGNRCSAAALARCDDMAIDLGTGTLGPAARRDRKQLTKLSATSGANRRVNRADSCLTADIDVADVLDSSTPANKISYEVSAVTTLEGPVADGR